MQCSRKKASTKKQKTCQTLASFTKKAYLCTRFRCYSSVVERILGKDEVPSSTLGSSSETTAETTHRSYLRFIFVCPTKHLDQYAPNW